MRDCSDRKDWEKLTKDQITQKMTPHEDATLSEDKTRARSEDKEASQVLATQSLPAVKVASYKKSNIERTSYEQSCSTN